MENKEITHTINPLLIKFHEVTASRATKTSPWEYTEKGPWFKDEAIGVRYDEFVDKANELKRSGKLAEAKGLLCNSAYAVELFINGVITLKMIEYLEEGISSDKVPLIAIPNQEVVILKVKLQLNILIVDCFSYKSFCFIDGDNKDL